MRWCRRRADSSPGIARPMLAFLSRIAWRKAQRFSRPASPRMPPRRWLNRLPTLKVTAALSRCCGRDPAVVCWVTLSTRPRYSSAHPVLRIVIRVAIPCWVTSPTRCSNGHKRIGVGWSMWGQMTACCMRLMLATVANCLPISQTRSSMARTMPTRCRNCCRQTTVTSSLWITRRQLMIFSMIPNSKPIASVTGARSWSARCGPVARAFMHWILRIR